MDPATIVGLVSSAAALARVCGSAATDLNTLVSKYKNAKLAILSMVQGLDTMQLAWSRIGKWAQNQAPDELLEDYDFIGRLQLSLETGSLVMDALNEELLIYKPSKMGLTQRTRAVWNEGTLRSHQERIRDQASSMTLLLQAIHLPTLGDRNNLLRASETQFGKSDESAYSIVPSRMSMSIYTGDTIDSGASESEVDLVYKPLTFENELFTARVYKRSYRTPALQQLSKGTEQKTSGKTRPRTVAQEFGEDLDESEADNVTIRGPGPTLWSQNEARIFTLRRLEGQPAEYEDTSGQMHPSPDAEAHLSFAEACEQGNVGIVETYLASGRDVHAAVSRKNRLFPDLSAIHHAAKGGHVQLVEILLSYGADKEMPSPRSLKRPLHLAVEAGHVAMVRYLLDKGTNIAALGSASAQAIHLAAGRGSMEMICLLLSRGAAIDSAMTNGDQPLHMASQNPDRGNVIRFLCSQGADIEAKTHGGCTPLYYASFYNNVDNLKALLELGAAHSPQGRWSLGLEGGYLGAIHLLLQHGMDPNRPDFGGRTALHSLFKPYTHLPIDGYKMPKEKEIVELLLVYGADVDLQDSKGDTPLHLLCSRRETQIEERCQRLQPAKILMKNMRDVNTVNLAGETALSLSILCSSRDLLSQSLINSGACLLVRKPGIEVRVELEHSPTGLPSVLNCHVRRDSDAWTKRLGFYEKGTQNSLARFNSRSLGELRQLLRINESFNLYDTSHPANHFLYTPSTLTNASHNNSPSKPPSMPPKPPLTHFLCLPLITPSSKPQFQASLARFTSEGTSQHAVPPKAIRPVSALHLTIGVMSLPTPDRLEAATSFLRSLDISAMLAAANGHLLTPLTFTGLHPMGTAENTSSLYAAPSSPSAAPLIPFCTALRDAFTGAELMVPETRPIKLHATVVNTIYAREARSGKKRWGKGSGKFDARELVERYREFEWARDVRLERVSICEMGAKKVMKGEVVVDQVYREVASVELPVIEAAPVGSV